MAQTVLSMKVDDKGVVHAVPSMAKLKQIQRVVELLPLFGKINEDTKEACHTASNALEDVLDILVPKPKPKPKPEPTGPADDGSNPMGE